MLLKKFCKSSVFSLEFLVKVSSLSVFFNKSGMPVFVFKFVWAYFQKNLGLDFAYFAICFSYSF